MDKKKEHKWYERGIVSFNQHDLTEIIVEKSCATISMLYGGDLISDVFTLLMDSKYYKRNCKLVVEGLNLLFRNYDDGLKMLSKARDQDGFIEAFNNIINYITETQGTKIHNKYLMDNYSSKLLNLYVFLYCYLEYRKLDLRDNVLVSNLKINVDIQKQEILFTIVYGKFQDLKDEKQFNNAREHFRYNSITPNIESKTEEKVPVKNKEKPKTSGFNSIRIR